MVRTSPEFGPAHYELSRLYREDGNLAKMEQGQKAYETARKARGKPLKQIIVEFHQGQGNRTE